MKHKYTRFAQHPRFRFVAFNMLMGHQARTSAAFFVKGRPDQNISAEDLRRAFTGPDETAQKLLRSITRFSNQLPGTRPFWTARHQELIAFVKNLGPAQLFLTTSAADLHWDDLMRHLPDYERWIQGDSAVLRNYYTTPKRLKVLLKIPLPYSVTDLIS
jgi:hypothetical protein